MQTAKVSNERCGKAADAPVVDEAALPCPAVHENANGDGGEGLDGRKRSAR